MPLFFVPRNYLICIIIIRIMQQPWQKSLQYTGDEIEQSRFGLLFYLVLGSGFIPLIRIQSKQL